MLNYVSWRDAALRTTIPSWQNFVGEYAAMLEGITAESLPEHIARFPALGARMRDPKGMLLAPNQRTQRAGHLVASAFALALVQSGWELQVQPGVFNLRHGEQELNPFLILEQLMFAKLSARAWISQCHDLGISHLALAPGHPRPSNPLAVPPTQPMLFHFEVESDSN